jgi:hypothetical protein
MQTKADHYLFMERGTAHVRPYYIDAGGHCVQVLDSVHSDMSQGSYTITSRPSRPQNKFTRYQLPGFGLPLNFTPYEEHTTNEYDFNTKDDKEILHSPLGDFGALYPSAIDGQRAR